MGRLKCLSSGSDGNSYIIECGGEKLLIELGITWRRILKGLDFDLSGVVGALCSHRHADHSKSITDAIKACIDVYSCLDVQAIHQKVKVLEKGRKTQIGGFRVQPIPLFHSVECIGFLIEHTNMGRLLFCTDTTKIPYNFKDVHHVLVEGNSDVETMIDNACDDIFSRSNSANHMDFNDTIDFLRRNYSKELQNVVLLHLSNVNSNERMYMERTQSALGFNNVYIADSGLELELINSEF